MCIIAIFSGIVLANNNFINTKAKAEETFISEPADYTKSDYLLLDNGEENQNRTIQDFSNDIKTAINERTNENKIGKKMRPESG